MSYPDTLDVHFPPTLVIDAYGTAAEQLANQLRHSGFTADSANTHEEALVAVRKHYYGSAIFLGDLGDPRNLACIAELRGEVPRTWIVMISSTEPGNTREPFGHYGVDALLITPFSMEDLISRLMAFSRRSRPP